MNAADRKQVAEIVAKLEDLKAQAEEQGGVLRELADAEREKFDNMSDGLQQSEQGQAIEQAADNLEEAADSAEAGSVDEALEALGNIEQ